MPRDLRAHLYDIRDACQAIEEFVRNKAYADYAADRAHDRRFSCWVDDGCPCEQD